MAAQPDALQRLDASAPLGGKNRRVAPSAPLIEAGPPAKLRILVCSHSHPNISHGGAEIAAFRLFSELCAHPGCEAWFLGCNTLPGAGRDGIALTQPFSPREYVYSTGGQFDWFRFANGDARFPGEFEALLEELRPDIVHLHHYVNYGVEILLTIRRTLPQARIVATLHEYLAICNHFGQMVKRGHFSLCDQASLAACHGCYPEHDAADFFMRERYIKLFFDHVDRFIAPSQFLADRYANWGVTAERLSVIENIIAPGLPVPPVLPPEPSYGGEPAALRIGFFGQISKLKGIDVLLDAADILAEKTQLKITFDIFGDYKGQPQAFQDAFLEQLAKVSRNVNYRGAYRQDQVDRLMRGVDAILVPSIWWENSPVVIQEAFRNNRPVLCSDIGGMAEKVRNGVDGYHFPVGSALELSYLLIQLYLDRSRLHAVRESMAKPPTVQEVLASHLGVYARLLGQRRAAAEA